MSDDGWDYGVEILRTRFDDELQAETLIMEETKLNHFSPVVGQRYLFVFDAISVKCNFEFQANCDLLQIQPLF